VASLRFSGRQRDVSFSKTLLLQKSLSYHKNTFPVKGSVGCMIWDGFLMDLGWILDEFGTNFWRFGMNSGRVASIGGKKKLAWVYTFFFYARGVAE
jgi:hypothetical protein